jgi:hypothetical protein
MTFSRNQVTDKCLTAMPIISNGEASLIIVIENFLGAVSG